MITSTLSKERQQQLFYRLAGDNDFQKLLADLEKQELKNLVVQVEPAQLHKTQGKALFIQTLLAECEAAKKA